VSDTVARADRQMYEAKRAGRNTVRLQLAEDVAVKIGG
jgi:PleD family two-component response regulator